MKHTWGLEHEETTRIKQGSSIYYMWRWLRLHVAQLIRLSYPLPKSSLFPRGINRNICVVATTCWNGTCSMLTSVKLTEGYLVVEITRELDKEPLLHCSSIYITYRWSILQQYVYLMSYYSSTMLLPQGYYAISIYPDIILFNLHHHVCTMCTPWETHVSWHHS